MFTALRHEPGDTYSDVERLKCGAVALLVKVIPTFASLSPTAPEPTS